MTIQTYIKDLAKTIAEWEHGRVLAEIVIASQSEWESLKAHLQDGGSPKDHALYYAHYAIGAGETYDAEVEDIREQFKNGLLAEFGK